MLAKPEYFSPTDEVCCWPGRRTGAAASGHHGRTADLHGTPAQTGRDVAESHREASGKAAVAELLTGQGAVAERLAGAPLLHRREAATGREIARHHRDEIGKNLKSTRKPHSELLVEEGEEDSILFCNFGGKM